MILQCVRTNQTQDATISYATAPERRHTMTKNHHIQSMSGLKRLSAALLRSAIVDLRKKDRKAFRHPTIKSVHQSNLDWLNEVPRPPAGRDENKQFPLSLVAELWGCETHWLRYRVALKAALDVNGPSRMVSMPQDEEARQRRVAEMVALERAEEAAEAESDVVDDSVYGDD